MLVFVELYYALRRLTTVRGQRLCRVEPRQWFLRSARTGLLAVLYVHSCQSISKDVILRKALAGNSNTAIKYAHVFAIE